jgi:hypothetical protein
LPATLAGARLGRGWGEGRGAKLSPNGDAIERRRRQARSWAGAGPISGWVAPTPAPTPTRWPRSRGRVFQPQIDPRPLSVESAPGSLTLSLADATGAAGALSGDPEAAPALISGAVGPASNDPVPRYYLLGATRAEVARVDWVRQSGTVSVQTIEHDAFPRTAVLPHRRHRADRVSGACLRTPTPRRICRRRRPPDRLRADPSSLLTTATLSCRARSADLAPRRSVLAVGPAECARFGQSVLTPTSLDEPSCSSRRPSRAAVVGAGRRRRLALGWQHARSGQRAGRQICCLCPWPRAKKGRRPQRRQRNGVARDPGDPAHKRKRGRGWRATAPASVAGLLSPTPTTQPAARRGSAISPDYSSPAMSSVTQRVHWRPPGRRWPELSERSITCGVTQCR